MAKVNLFSAYKVALFIFCVSILWLGFNFITPENRMAVADFQLHDTYFVLPKQQIIISFSILMALFGLMIASPV